MHRAIVFGTLAALQITAAIFIFRKWSGHDIRKHAIYPTSNATSPVTSSYYENDLGRRRGSFEMKLKVSSLFGGTDLDANAVNIVFNVAGSGISNATGVLNCMYPTGSPGGIQCRGRDAVSISDHTLPILYIGGGTCTVTGDYAWTTTHRDSTCSDHGLCFAGVCVCDLDRYGPRCGGALSLIGRVDSKWRGVLAGEIQSTAAPADVNLMPTQAELDRQPHVHVGPYPNSPAELNVVVLMGVYVIVGIVLTAARVVWRASFWGDVVVAALGTAVVVSSISSFQWQSLTGGAGELGGAVIAGQGNVDPPMLSAVHLLLAITLTVITRWSPRWISIGALVVKMLFVESILYGRPHRMQQLAMPILVAFLTFETIYGVSRVFVRRWNDVISACGVLAISLTVWFASRRAANLYDTTTGSSTTLVGTPFMQLGHRNGLCDFIHSDILADPGDDDWAGLRTCWKTDPFTDVATHFSHCCTGTKGTHAAYLRAGIWGPLVLCIVALAILHLPTHTLIEDIKWSMDGRGTRYSRIRVQTSLDP